MKKIFLFAVIAVSSILSSCEGPEGPRGATGYSAEAAVYEIDHVNFTSTGNYGIFVDFSSPILSSDHVLVYRLAGVDQNEDVWNILPKQYFRTDGTLDFEYDYDFTRNDVNILLRGNDLGGLTDQYRLDQVFRIVVIPGQFANKKSQRVDFNDYKAVIKAFSIDENKMKSLN